MDPELIRAALGLPADATEEQVTAAAESRKAELAKASTEDPPAGDPPAGDPPPATEPPATEPPAGDPPAGDPPPADPPAGDPPTARTVTVDAEVWEQTVQGAQDGVAARAEQVSKHRENLLQDAAKAGKIPPASIEHYRKLHQADAKGTETLLEELAPGVVPVTARGSSQAPESGDPGGNAGPAASAEQLATAVGSFGIKVVGR